ncbi:MAG: aconitase family protein, partial [Erysipelotrichaceae bacterium]
EIIASGSRVLESACGPCIGMGQSPKSDAVSLRTFNRNFYGRSGTNSASVCLVSPEVAAVSAIKGVISDPRDFDYELPTEPLEFLIDDRMIIKPNPKNCADVVRGPNIKPLPINSVLDNTIDKKVMIKVEDNITTDHIVPGGAKVLPYRSNIEKISEFIFMNVDPAFHDNCKANNGGYIIAGSNYGQGSSREHAALAPMYLGIKVVIAKSFARIHRSNLINFGILPVIFNDETAYDTIDQFDELVIDNLDNLSVDVDLQVKNITKNSTFSVKHNLTELDINIIKLGGLLNYIKSNQ